MTSVAESLLSEAGRLHYVVVRETKPDRLAQTFADKLETLEHIIFLYGSNNGIASLADLLRAE
jgi:hypothetical protein